MLKKYPNALMERLRTNGLNPGDFRTNQEDVQGRHVFSIRFRESPFAFKFWADGGATFAHQCCFYTSTCLGGVPNPAYKESRDKLDAFSKIEIEFNLWLKSVRRLLA